ncbi:MAG: hypothetical protein H6713_24825 [Myxococcales bacterium]|nr:hypothetical protein [Myxococcales bacterium]
MHASSLGEHGTAARAAAGERPRGASRADFAPRVVGEVAQRGPPRPRSSGERRLRRGARLCAGGVGARADIVIVEAARRGRCVAVEDIFTVFDTAADEAGVAP